MIIKFKYFSDRGVLKREGELQVDQEIEVLGEFAYDLHRDHKLPGLPSGRWFGPLLVSCDNGQVHMCHTRPLSWIARDDDGQLKIFDRKPNYDKEAKRFVCANEDTLFSWVNPDMFPEVREGELRCVR